jgi:hypothetical protein
MSADLTVVAVRRPPLLRAPCPTTILVVVRNQGSDATEPAPYEVTVDIGTDDDGDLVRFSAPVVGEANQLQAGASIVVPVEVRFPCASPAFLVATVDEALEVPNNVPTSPSLRLPGLTTVPRPWLAATMRVGLRDPTGNVTRDPAAFCPGRDLEQEITIENRGCAPTRAGTATVSLEDVNAVPATRFTSVALPVPALAPGARFTTTTSLSTPASATGTSGTLVVRLDADSNLDNTDTCDRADTTAEVARPFTAGGPPTLTLTVGGTVRPGEEPSLSWRLANTCSDIRLADIRILFGNAPTELHRSQRTIGLQTVVGDDVAPNDVVVPSAIESQFWTVGTKSIEIEITGRGTAPGPYRASALLTVVPETLDPTWWLWARPPAASWKRSYSVRGSFVNRGRAAMTVSSFSALEHPLDVVGTAQDAVVPALSPMSAALASRGVPVPVVWTRFQAWPWLVQGTPSEGGPRARTFSYVASCTVSDTFGNTYPTFTSAPLVVGVAVGAGKLFALDTAIVLLFAGYAYLAGALVVSGAGPYGWIGAVILAAFGMGLIIAAALYLDTAYDPPIPDFREPEPPDVDPQAWTVPEPDREDLRPLHTLALVVTRAESARGRAVRHRAAAWAASLDDDEERRVRFGEVAQRQLDRLGRLADAAGAAADEARESLDAMLGGVSDLPTPDAMREAVGGFAETLNLQDAERRLVQEQMDALDVETLQRAVEFVRAQGVGAIGEVLRRMHEAAREEHAGLDFLAR